MPVDVVIRYLHWPHIEVWYNIIILYWIALEVLHCSNVGSRLRRAIPF